MLINLILGIGVGLSFGYISQRGRFWMLSAFYEVLTGRAPDMLRAYLLAVLIQMVGVNILLEFGYLHVTPPPFFGIATALSGLIFGLGMVLAMGCAGAVLYRAGEGKVDYFIVAMAYAVTAWASNNWLVHFLRPILGGEGFSWTLPHILTVNRWPIIAIFLAGGMVWIARGHRHPYHGGWNWSRTGLILGLLGILTWVISGLNGKPSGLGIVQGGNSWSSFFRERNYSAIDWTLYMVLSIPLGSFIASKIRGESEGKPFRSSRISRALTGGVLMGLGASVAGGDNVLHGLSGTPLLAVSSLIFMIFVFLGVWLGVRLKWIR